MGKFNDLTGQKFGRLTVIKRVENKGQYVCWLCECECGNKKIVKARCLTKGETLSCGCLKKETKEDLTGQKFGRLTVIGQADRDKRNKVRWLCECECGNMTITYGYILKEGKTKSCGCLLKDHIKKLNEEQWKDENFRKSTIDRSKKQMEEQWKDEEYRQARINQVKKQWENENFKSSMTGENSPKWKGGITPITLYLRELNRPWLDECKKQANYVCQLTGKRGQLHTHHLKAFSTIVLEAHNTHNIQIKNQVKDYTDNELNLLKDYVNGWHKDNSNGIVLSEDIHTLFHKEYGYGNNTLEQFEEFKERYLAGEFKEILK